MDIPRVVQLAFNLYVVWAVLHMLPARMGTGIWLADTYQHERFAAADPTILHTLRQMAYGQLAISFLLVLGTGYLLRTNQSRGKVLFILYTLGSTSLTARTFPDFEDLEVLSVFRYLLDATLTISISILLLRSLFSRPSSTSSTTT